MATYDLNQAQLDAALLGVGIDPSLVAEIISTLDDVGVLNPNSEALTSIVQSGETADSHADVVIYDQTVSGLVTDIPDGANAIVFASDVGVDANIGGSGHKIVVSGDGDDTLEMTGSSIDEIFSGGGDDFVSAGKVHDTIHGGLGDDTLVGGQGHDTLFGDEGSDVLSGGKGNDSLVGGVGDDSIDGGDGNDTISGGDGNDTLMGGAGNDVIAGDHNDTIVGGAGQDALELARSFSDVAEDGIQTVGELTTIEFTDGTVVEAETIETIIFEDQVVKL